MYNFVHLGRFSSVFCTLFHFFPSMGFLWIVVAVAFMDSENIFFFFFFFRWNWNVRFESSQMIFEIYNVILCQVADDKRRRRRKRRRMILSSYLENRLRLNVKPMKVLFVQSFSESKTALQFHDHKTRLEVLVAHTKQIQKNVT